MPSHILEHETATHLGTHLPVDCYCPHMNTELRSPFTPKEKMKKMHMLQLTCQVSAMAFFAANGNNTNTDTLS